MWISCAWALVLSFSQAYKRAHSAPSFALPYYLQVNAIRTAICQTIDSIFKWQQILARACSWHGTTKQHTACDSNSNSDSDGDGDLREVSYVAIPTEHLGYILKPYVTVARQIMLHRTEKYEG